MLEEPRGVFVGNPMVLAEQMTGEEKMPGQSVTVQCRWQAMDG